jgi:hypothetical protein
MWARQLNWSNQHNLQAKEIMKQKGLQSNCACPINDAAIVMREGLCLVKFKAVIMQLVHVGRWLCALQSPHRSDCLPQANYFDDQLCTEAQKE